MAKTSAQRQAQYRKNRPYSGIDGNGERRLNLWLDTSAFLALERLANRNEITKRAMLESLLLAEDKRILSGLTLNSSELDEYFQTTPVTP